MKTGDGSVLSKRMVRIDNAAVGVGGTAEDPSLFPSEGPAFEPCMNGWWIMGDTREVAMWRCKNSESSMREMEKEAARLYVAGAL